MHNLIIDQVIVSFSVTKGPISWVAALKVPLHLFRVSPLPDFCVVGNNIYEGLNYPKLNIVIF